MTKIMIDIIIFILSFGIWILLSTFLHPVLSWFISINLIGLFIYLMDKGASEKNVGMRIPNQTLYIVAVIGGVFGSLAGLYLFKHKTLNIHFKLHLWFIASLYLLIPLIWIFLQR